MKNIVIGFILTILLFSVGHAQNFKKYHQLSYKGLCDTNCTIDDKLKIYQEQFKIMTPELFDIIIAAELSFKAKRNNLFKKFVFLAAKKGLKYEEINGFFPIVDSVLIKRNLFDNYQKKYSKNRKKCNIEASTDILILFERDQMMRSASFCSITDTGFTKCYYDFFLETDSLNFYSLKKIMQSENFNYSDLTVEAKKCAFMVIMHSLTNRYTINIRDSVISELKKEMERGNISNQDFASAIDRYYRFAFNKNYFYEFIDKRLPIFDIENLDKRRTEIGLWPLYIKYYQLDIIDKLPKDYNYDIKTIEQW